MIIENSRVKVLAGLGQDLDLEDFCQGLGQDFCQGLGQDCSRSCGKSLPQDLG